MYTGEATDVAIDMRGSRVFFVLFFLSLPTPETSTSAFIMNRPPQSMS